MQDTGEHHGFLLVLRRLLCGPLPRSWRHHAAAAHLGEDHFRAHLADPDHHGAGTSTLLMEATIDEARATGARGVWLGVSEENARANAFYARHGFEQVGTKRFHIGDVWEDDHVRERAL